MRTTMGDLRTIIAEAAGSTKVKVGPVRGNSRLGFNARLSKTWAGYENEMAWMRLRRVLVDLGSDVEHDSWLTQDYSAGPSGTEQFIDVPFRSMDAAGAELERQAFIGDLEAQGFDVESSTSQMKPSGHPYR